MGESIQNKGMDGRREQEEELKTLETLKGIISMMGYDVERIHFLDEDIATRKKFFSVFLRNDGRVASKVCMISSHGAKIVQIIMLTAEVPV